MPITADAAVGLPELQGAVQAVFYSPVAADQLQQGGRVHRLAGDVVAYGTLSAAAGSGALCLHADQAAHTGPGFGVRHPLAEAGTAQDGAGAPLTAVTVALEGLATVLRLGCESPPGRYRRRPPSRPSPGPAAGPAARDGVASPRATSSVARSTGRAWRTPRGSRGSGSVARWSAKAQRVTRSSGS